MNEADRQRCIAHVSAIPGDYEITLFYCTRYDQALAVAKALPSDTYRFWSLQLEDGHILYCRARVIREDEFKAAIHKLRSGCDRWVIRPEPTFAL